MSIFDLVTSSQIVMYWELLVDEREPYLGEELWPADKKLGMKLEWMKGANGVPIVLKHSALDAAAIPRPRIGFEKLETEMPFFKESKYIDEQLRQQLNMVLETNNQAYIDAVLNRIFNDKIELLESAAVSRERMRMMALTTGYVVGSSNGQIYEYDYLMPEDHKGTVTASWSDPKSSILDDLREARDKILEDTGVKVERIIMKSRTFKYFRMNEEIRISISPDTSGKRFISDTDIKELIMAELDMEIVMYDKRYRDENGVVQSFIPDDIVVMFPTGTLGTTWFGTTPEESDLMGGKIDNVTITDVGVAVTTMTKEDPVQVETKVSMICLPDFPTADQVFILDVIANEEEDEGDEGEGDKGEGGQ